MKHIYLLILLLLPLVCVAQNKNDLSASDIAEYDAIEEVVEDFRIAIINKDKTKFLNLFHKGEIPRVGVFSESSLKYVQKKHPKAVGVTTSSYHEFIEWIIVQKEKIDEKFWNLKVNTDQNIASVYFDYSFHKGDIKSNWGQESWQLIKTNKGWKINSVVYSINLNQQVETPRL
jgi:hypothetical protein